MLMIKTTFSFEKKNLMNEHYIIKGICKLSFLLSLKELLLFSLKVYRVFFVNGKEKLAELAIIIQFDLLK